MQKLPLFAALLALDSDPALKGLVALRAVSNDALKAEELPKRLKLLNWGDNDTLKGNVHVGPRTLASLAARQAEFGYDRIALDYGHNSLPGHANFKPDPREVAAYGVPRVIENEGLFLEEIDYTPSGVKHAREYCDLSPTPLLEEGEVIFLHSVALCPQGAVKGLSFYSTEFLHPKSLDMNHKSILCTLLGLSAEASDDEIKAAAEKFAGKKDEKVVAMTPDQLGQLVEKVTALTTDKDNLLERLNAIERENVTALAIREGKVIPMSAKDLSLDQFKALVAELPAGQVPMEQRTPEGLAAFSSGVGRNSVADTIRETLGISRETWDAHNK